MAIIRWNPWNMDRFFDEDFEMPTLPGLSRLAGQGLNLYETNDNLVAEAALPGIADDRIDITIDEGVVRIVGSSEEKKEEEKRHYMSTLSSSYNYSFRLPQGIIQDTEPQCELNNGILTLVFPKIQKTPPKKVKIGKKNSGEKK